MSTEDAGKLVEGSGNPSGRYFVIPPTKGMAEAADFFAGWAEVQKMRARQHAEDVLGFHGGELPPVKRSRYSINSAPCRKSSGYGPLKSSCATTRGLGIMMTGEFPEKPEGYDKRRKKQVEKMRARPVMKHDEYMRTIGILSRERCAWTTGKRKTRRCRGFRDGDNFLCVKHGNTTAGVIINEKVRSLPNLGGAALNKRVIEHFVKTLSHAD